MLYLHRSPILLLATLSLLAPAAGCASDGAGPLDDFGSYQSFAPATRAVGSTGFVSVSTVPGNIGCGLAESFEATPGAAGEQVFANFSVSQFACDGSYPVIASRCAPPEPESPGGGGDDDGDVVIGDGPGGAGALPSDCAIYRRWDETGELIANVYARAGSVTLSEGGIGECNVQLDFVFPEGTFSDGFTIADGAECVQ